MPGIGYTNDREATEETAPTFRLKRQRENWDKATTLSQNPGRTYPVGPGAMADTQPWQRSHQRWQGTGMERSTLAYPFLLPSGLLPGPPIGQTQKAAS